MIHPIFHISLLKQKVEDSTFHIIEDDNILLQPETILDTCWVKKGSKLIEEILVKWKHLPTEDATWRSTQDLLKQFTSLNVEDKVPVKDGSDDKPQWSQRKPRRNLKYLNWTNHVADLRHSHEEQVK